MLILILVIVAITISSYSLITESKSDPLKIFITEWAPYGLVYVAQEKGIFEKNQVDVEIILLHESESLLSFPKGFTADGSLEVFADVIFYDTNYVDSQFVYAIDESGNADVIVSKFNSIKELQGKTIGIWELGGFSHLFVLALLENNGINPNDVTFREVIHSDVVSKLDQGLIDAGHSFNKKNIDDAINSGYNIIATERDTPGLIVDGIMFKTEVIKNNHDGVFNFVKSFSETQDYCKNNLDECSKIIAQKFGYDSNLAKDGLTNVDLKYFEDNLKLFDNQENSLYESGKFIIEKLQQYNQISYSPDIHDVINPDFVNELAEMGSP
jgi:NitT/TauT family transport system substrate-binding protein